jgi:hypothetical protein
MSPTAATVTPADETARDAAAGGEATRDDGLRDDEGRDDGGADAASTGGAAAAGRLPGEAAGAGLRGVTRTVVADDVIGAAEESHGPADEAPRGSSSSGGREADAEASTEVAVEPDGPGPHRSHATMAPPITDTTPTSAVVRRHLGVRLLTARLPTD